MSLLKIGTFLACRRRYKVEKFIAAGGFSELYTARNVKTNELVVIKVLDNSQFADLNEVEGLWYRERAFINILSETTCSSEYQCNHF